MLKFQTIFGIRVPVIELPKLGRGAITVVFVVKGRVVSKKNNETAYTVKSDAEKFLYQTFKNKGQISLNDALNALTMVRVNYTGNTAWKAFLKRFSPVISEQMAYWADKYADKGLKFPLRKASVALKFAYNDRYRTDSSTNKNHTIMDLLVACGVIKDDSDDVVNSTHIQSARFYKRLGENICSIYLTFKSENIQNDP